MSWTMRQLAKDVGVPFGMLRQLQDDGLLHHEQLGVVDAIVARVCAEIREGNPAATSSRRRAATVLVRGELAMGQLPDGALLVLVGKQAPRLVRDRFEAMGLIAEDGVEPVSLLPVGAWLRNLRRAAGEEARLVG